MTQDTLITQYIHITTVVLTYWFVSIATVFVNKALLSSQEVNLDAPLFVTWFQCCVTASICFCLSLLSGVVGFISFPKGSPLNVEIAKKVLPVTLLFVAMISFNNLCLKYVGVAFYYIGRSLTTVFNVFFTFALLGQKTSCGAVICCAVIVSGFWLGVDQESLGGSLSLLGTLYGVLASIFVSLYSIYMKKVLPHINSDIWLLTYYNNVYSVIVFIPLMILNGEHTIVANYPRLFDLVFWCMMTGGGLCGFAIGYVTALQIKVTSPLTHNISGTAKACVQTVLATYWFSESKTLLWWLSNWVVLGGSAAYTRVKQLEMKEEHKSSKLSQTA